MNHAATQNLILNVDPNFSYVEQKELPFVSGIKAISFILKKEFRSFKKQETSLSVHLLFNVESAGFPDLYSLTQLPDAILQVCAPVQVFMDLCALSPPRWVVSSPFF